MSSRGTRNVNRNLFGHVRSELTKFFVRNYPTKTLDVNVLLARQRRFSRANEFLKTANRADGINTFVSGKRYNNEPRSLNHRSKFKTIERYERCVETALFISNRGARATYSRDDQVRTSLHRVMCHVAKVLSSLSFERRRREK